MHSCYIILHITHCTDEQLKYCQAPNQIKSVYKLCTPKSNQIKMIWFDLTVTLWHIWYEPPAALDPLLIPNAMWWHLQLLIVRDITSHIELNYNQVIYLTITILLGTYYCSRIICWWVSLIVVFLLKVATKLYFHILVTCFSADMYWCQSNLFI